MIWDDLIYVGAVIGAIGTIAGVPYAAFKWGRPFKNWLGHKLISKSENSNSIPKETLRLVPEANQNGWHMGSQGGVPAMQVVTRWHVTNITGRPVRVLRGIAKVKGSGSEYEGHVMVRDARSNVYGGEFSIRPHATSPVTADFWFKPPVRKEGEELELWVTLIDQFGNPHVYDSLTLDYI